MEVDILTADEENVIDCLVASVRNRVYNVVENVDATQDMDETVGAAQETQEKSVGVTQGTQKENVGATQGTEGENVGTTEGENVTQETQPQETMTQENTIDANQQTQKNAANVGKKGSKKGELNKGKEKQTSTPKRKRPVRRGSRTGITINDDLQLMCDSSSDESNFEAEYMVGHKDSFCEVGDASQDNIQMSEANEICSDNDSITFTKSILF